MRTLKLAFLVFAGHLALFSSLPAHIGDSSFYEQAYGSNPVPLPPPSYLTRGKAAGSNFTTLREAAAARGLFMGTAVNFWALTNTSQPVYRNTVLSEYDLQTAEVECKFAPTQPQPGPDGFSFTDCDTIANFTLGPDGGTFRGHNTVWGNSNPAWLTSLTEPTQLSNALTLHVSKVLEYYQNRPYCWDIVNEAVSDSSDPKQLYKNNTWFPLVPNYVSLAFKTAKAAYPHVKLFYNDYSWEAYSSVKAGKIRGMIAGMQKAGVPIDGVGMQMHISVNHYPDPADVSKNMAALAAMGLEVHITEMDVSCPNCTAALLQKQASVYGAMLRACLTNPNCKSFETWGFTDGHTWLGEDKAPLPFDAQYNKKPAYYELLSVLNDGV